MTKRDADTESDDGIVSEDITQLIEHIELTGEQRLNLGPGWEMATPADDLDEAPILVDDAQPQMPDLEGVPIAEDIELFTDTELDLNRRLLQVEDEQLALTAVLAAEREQWQKRVENLRMELAERNRLLAGRDGEIEDLSAQLASMTLERDRTVAQLQELRRSAGQAETTVIQDAPTPAEDAVDNLHERLRAHAGRHGSGGELRRLLGRFFGAETGTASPPPPAAVAAGAAGSLDDPTPRRVLLEEPRRTAEYEELAAEPGSEPRLRHYLIGMDLVGRVHEITQARISIGRTRDNELRIVDSTVSRLHAVLKLNGGDVTVIDANSRNGVYVNGIQMRHAKLADGDVVTFGTVRFRYRVGSGAAGGGFGPA